MKPRFRIRRCKGNPRFWVLVALHSDGSEIESYGAGTTAISVDSLLTHKVLMQGETIELIKPKDETRE